MRSFHRRRRFVLMCITCIVVVGGLFISGTLQPISTTSNNSVTTAIDSPALSALATLSLKGRAPKTNYARTQFGDGWTTTGGCDTRNVILHRDLTNTVIDTNCTITKGTIDDPYTGKVIEFTRGSSSSSAVQIDHVVALSDAWQTGAQQLGTDTRISMANDPLELLAVDGPANQQKSDGDTATWLPSNKAFRCQYVARQIAVKQKYSLWVTQPEHDVMQSTLGSCAGQALPTK